MTTQNKRVLELQLLPPERALALLLPLVPAATAPLAPTILLPAEDGVLASSDRRAAPGGSLPSPTNATCRPSHRICHQPPAATQKEPAHKQLWFATQSSPRVEPGLLQHVREVGRLMGQELRAVLKALGEFAPG